MKVISIFLSIVGLSPVFCGAAMAEEPRDRVWAEVDALYLHRHLGRNLDQSVDRLRERLAKNPKETEALWRLGRSLEKVGEREVSKKRKLSIFGEAETALRQSVALKPDNADAHFFLGLTLGRIGQTRGIIKSLFLVGPIRKEMRSALTIDPKYGGAHQVLGEMLRNTPSFAGGSKKEAVLELEKAVEGDPHCTGFYTSLAHGYLDVGDRAKAKAALEKVLEIQVPSDPGDYDDDVKEAREMLSKLRK